MKKLNRKKTNESKSRKNSEPKSKETEFTHHPSCNNGLKSERDLWNRAAEFWKPKDVLFQYINGYPHKYVFVDCTPNGTIFVEEIGLIYCKIKDPAFSNDDILQYSIRSEELFTYTKNIKKIRKFEYRSGIRQLDLSGNKYKAVFNVSEMIRDHKEKRDMEREVEKNKEKWLMIADYTNRLLINRYGVHAGKKWWRKIFKKEE